jgi:nitrogen-specific signal transduction histidine kinase
VVAGPELTRLFHELNNQLGVILANAELLESKLSDDAQKSRASQVVTGALDAIGTVQRLRQALGAGPNGGGSRL